VPHPKCGFHTQLLARAIPMPFPRTHLGPKGSLLPREIRGQSYAIRLVVMRYDAVIVAQGEAP
jgi:hypothetical protein